MKQQTSRQDHRHRNQKLNRNHIVAQERKIHYASFKAVDTPTDTSVVWGFEIPTPLPILCQRFRDGPDEFGLVSAINVTGLINHR